MGKLEILICDDEKNVRESLKLILEDDYKLEFAGDGLEALEKLRTFPARLVLLDIKMPKMHGLEILRQIKALKPSLPVVIVTGYQSSEIAQEALKSGAADYITKPFDSQKIKKTVLETLRG